MKLYQHYIPAVCLKTTQKKHLPMRNLPMPGYGPTDMEDPRMLEVLIMAHVQPVENSRLVTELEISMMGPHSVLIVNAWTL